MGLGGGGRLMIRRAKNCQKPISATTPADAGYHFLLYVVTMGATELLCRICAVSLEITLAKFVPVLF